MGVVELLVVIGVGFVGALTVQLITFVFALRLKRVDVVDVAWGLSFLGVTVLSLTVAKSPESPITLLVDWLVFVWALRLTYHILRRFLRTNVQDERYTELMKTWPKRYRWVQVLFKIFVLQASLATIVGLPILAVHADPAELSWLAYVGLTVWVIGFVCESVADWQLKQFLARPDRPELMTEGLWHYSRHPNYFGEITMWWGMALIACTTAFWWVGIIGALTITLLIRFVSGVPLAEARSASKKGWSSYQQRTSVLIPWLPKN